MRRFSDFQRVLQGRFAAYAFQSVSVAVNGRQAEALLRAQVQLGADARDVHIQRAAVQIGFVAPDVLENIGPRQRAVQVAKQQPRQGEFLGGQDHGQPVARH